jgi:hypothetical protein
MCVVSLLIQRQCTPALSPRLVWNNANQARGEGALFTARVESMRMESSKRPHVGCSAQSSGNRRMRFRPWPELHPVQAGRMLAVHEFEFYASPRNGFPANPHLP